MALIQLSPKAQFQELKELATNFGNMAQGSTLQTGANYAMSEFALNHHPSQEQLAGAKIFLSVLLNLAEKDSPRPRFPDKSLVDVSKHQITGSSQI